MRTIEEILIVVLETLGFEAVKLALGDFLPGAIIGLFPAAMIGGVVSDWKYNHRSRIITLPPWEWIAAVVVFASTMFAWYAIFIT